MNTLREAAQQALAALENLSNCYVGDHDSAGECASCHERSYRPHAPDCEKQNAITALRAALPCTYKCEAWPECACAALAQQEQEPVAWIHKLHYLLGHAENMPPADRALALGWEPLYTTPPRREWKSLSEEEIWKDDRIMAENARCGLMMSDLSALARAIEAALKEKNNG